MPRQNNQALDILKEYWGYTSFRGIQQDIIQSICAGRDTLGLMPTGGGKSVTFQVPSLMMDGVCIVITPLIALMKDQVEHLRDRGIKATAVYSGMTYSDVLTAFDNCILGKYKFLYISPERLKSELFQAKLSHMHVNFITVDEAHCISQWGYDFRPSYLNISLIRKLKPEVPLLAITATATPRVVEDIQRQLQFREPNIMRMSFERANLSYIVRESTSKETTLLQILQQTAGSAIVYTRNREQTAQLAKYLSDNGISAIFYHAGLENADKDVRQQLWQDGMVRVMVCTNAFGMGIDKADVRTVIHIGVPDSVEAYFQEAGRAGRDGLPSQAILLKGPHDVANLRRHIDTAFPTKQFIREAYQNICYYYQLAVGDGNGLRKEFNINDFCRHFRYFPLPLLSAFRLLEHAGYLQYTDPEDSSSCVKIVVDKNELYRIHHLPAKCEAVLQALMRNYNGLFADLMPIEEVLLAQRTALNHSEVYEALLTLNSMGIIYYIPFKHVAHLTFLQSRVETDEITFSTEVYEHRRMELVQRVNAMIRYLTAKTTCRSRLLLEYFGQTDASDCGHCDTCLAYGYADNSTTTEQADRAQQAIVALLQDGKPHYYQELKTISLPLDSIKQAIETLLAEGEVTYQDGLITLT
ncbi:MAG: RecQ family ATP-dependent DNA helicase [Bacteroidaceae bacterium]|nr:RecQ family ATP-dependent DNA helicase [Bacteroidaceae bacterium]